MKVSLFAIAFVISVTAAKGSAAIRCHADLSAMKRGFTVDVQIVDETLAKVSGNLNVSGVVTVIDGAEVLNFPVRSGLDFSDLANVDSLRLNPGEQRIALIQTYLAEPTMKPVLNLDGSLNLKEVASVRIYDLGHDAISNEFGGSPLLDLLSSKGELLGRFMQGVAITACK